MAGVPTLAEILSARGYVTAAVVADPVGRPTEWPPGVRVFGRSLAGSDAGPAATS